MKHVRAHARYWLAGTLAAAGVVLARLLAPALPAGTPRLLATVGGQLLALAGLALICLGVSRRRRRAEPVGAEAKPAA